MEKEQVIKTEDLCERCRFAFAEWCRGRRCYECNMDGDGVCLCTTIARNTPCPYFAEGGTTA